MQSVVYPTVTCSCRSIRKPDPSKTNIVLVSLFETTAMSLKMGSCVILQVFQKIQGRINKGLSKHTAQELEQRLAKQYQDYLHTLNTRAGVFRDTIIESDYDPLEARCVYLMPDQFLRELKHQCHH